MRAQLIITLEDNGQINVTGPIQDKIFVYGLLESAKDAVREYVDKNGKQIVAPHPLLNLQALKERNGNG